MLSKILRGAILATFVVGATVAQADPFADPAVSPKLGGFTYEGGLYTQSVNLRAPLNQNSTSAGLLKGQFDPEGDLNNVSDFFTFFCIDLYQSTSPLNSSVPYVRLSSAFAPVVSTGDDQQLKNLFASYAWPTAGNNAYALAMQLAVWNIAYDSDTSVTDSASSFWAANVDSATATLAHDMLVAAATPNLLGQNNLDGFAYTLWRFNSPIPGATTPSYQDFITFTRVPKDPPTVPLPGTLALFGIGLAGLGLARRKS